MRSILNLFIILLIPSILFSEVKIGAILPLTGEGSFWGENARNGIMMAVKDVNDNGGLAGKELKVIIEDGKCSAKDSVNAMQKLINIDHVAAVIGEICDTASQAIAPIGQSKKIVTITPCSEAPSITVNRDYTFRTWAPNHRQGKLMAEFVIRKLSFKTASILSIGNDFGIPLAEAFERRFKELGGSILSKDTYTPDNRDFKSQVLKIKKLNPQAVYLVSFHSDGILAVKQMKELGLKQQILGASPINSQEGFFEPLGEAAEGIILSDLMDTTTKSFRERYHQQFKKVWPGVSSCAAVAYDDVMLLADAIKSVGTTSDKIKDHLYSLKEYPGVSGPITFDKNGDLDRKHAIFQVRKGQLSLY